MILAWCIRAVLRPWEGRRGTMRLISEGKGNRAGKGEEGKRATGEEKGEVRGIKGIVVRGEERGNGEGWNGVNGVNGKI